MPAAQISAQAAAPKVPVQVGKPKEEGSTKGFANLLQQSINKGDVKATPLPLGIEKKIPKNILGEFAQGLGEIDLSALGEVAEEDGKKGAIKLADILADLSHKGAAPVGSEVINIKTVLGSKNDDPKLISKDLIALVPKEQRAEVAKELIEGAKQVLRDQLERRIPKNRVPKTLKGLLETAIRFNMVVTDIKLENLPESKITKGLLKTLEAQGKLEPKTEVALRPKMAGKINPKDLQKNGEAKPLQKAVAEQEVSPLEQILKGEKEQPLEESKKQAMAKSEVATPSVKNDAKEKKKEKVDTKIDSKLMAKEAKASEVMRDASAMATQQAVNTQSKKQGNLESLMSNEEASSEQTVAKTESEASSPHTTKQTQNPVKAEDGLKVKMAEARQLVSQLSSDIKEAMQNYKPPFTKLSMKLNPERLGEIDVMMVQRGSNVHINLTSNGAALGILQQNSADLKAALNSAGLSDATMNFSSNGENRNPSEQQQQQQRHTTAEHYAEMTKLMEDLDELEIVVPNYV